MNWDWKMLDGCSACHIQSPFLSVIHFHKSSWICTSNIVEAGLSRLTRLAGAHPRARGQTFLCSQEVSGGHNSPIGQECTPVPAGGGVSRGGVTKPLQLYSDVPLKSVNETSSQVTIEPFPSLCPGCPHLLLVLSPSFVKPPPPLQASTSCNQPTLLPPCLLLSLV